MKRRGVSLIELMVVILILLMITAAAIPVMRQPLAHRRTRESARIVSSFFEMAKNKARSTGRPVGVRIDALENSPVGAMKLTLVECPPPWAGDNLNSTITRDAGVVAFPQGDSWQGKVKDGDMIKLNYQGHLWQIRNTADPSMAWTFTSETAQYPFPNISTPGRPFQIFRQPVASAAPPQQLPDGMVIDLGASGIGGSAGLPSPAIVIFNSSGVVGSVSIGGSVPFRPTAPIYLLIGKRDKLLVSQNNYSTSLTPADQAAVFNWRDVENVWVSINPQTGLVASSEVAEVAANLALQASIVGSREHARAQQTMGGR